MKLIGWLVRLGVFFVMVGFALSNTETATLRFFGIPQFEWRAPLVLFLLVFFAGGALLGVLAAMPMVMRRNRELAAIRRSPGTPNDDATAQRAFTAAGPADRTESGPAARPARSSAG